MMMQAGGWDTALQLSALVLSVVNGLILVRVHFRDRAKLHVSPIHPDTYQWWFQGPPGAYRGQATQRWGFVVYVGISNKGYRPVTMNRWRLTVRARNGKRAELRALNIPQASFTLGGTQKTWPVLGQKGPHHDGDLRIDSGDSISGMAFYVYEWVGSDEWQPNLRDREVVGHFKVQDVYGGRARCKIEFREQSTEEIERILPGLNALLVAIETENVVR